MDNSNVSKTVLKPDLSAFSNAMGSTPTERINWLAFHAKISNNTARAWLAGDVSRVDLPVAAAIMDAVNAETLDQIIKPERAHE